MDGRSVIQVGADIYLLNADFRKPVGIKTGHLACPETPGCCFLVTSLIYYHLGMFGYIGETEDTIKDTIRFAKKLNTHVAAFFIASPFPGTRLYEEALEKGYLARDVSWLNYSPLSNVESVLNLPDLSRETIRKWHRKALKSYYIRPRYIIGRLLTVRHWHEIVPPDCISQVERESAGRERNVVGRYETKLLAHSGEHIPVIVSATSLFENDRFSGVLSVFTDIRDRVRAEQELRASEAKLERARRMESLGTLAGGVAHDLHDRLHPEVFFLV